MSSLALAPLRVLKGITRRIGFAQQIVLITMLVAVLISGSITGMTVSYVHGHLLRNISEKEESLLQLEAQRLTLRLNAIGHNLTMMASSSLVEAAVIDTAGQERYFIPMVQEYRVSDDIPVGVALYDFEGNLILASQSNMPKSLSRGVWLERVNHGRPQSFIQESEGRPWLMVAIPVNSPLSHMPEGMVVGRIDPWSILNEQRKLAVDRSFELLSENWSLVTIGEVAKVEKMLSIDSRLNLLQPFDSLWLTLRMVQDWQKAMAPLYDLQALLLALITAAVAFNAGIAWLLGRHLAKPLVRLASVAQQVVSTGNLQHALPTDQAGEIGTLANAFGNMLQHLDDLHDTLEQRVQQRTAELHAAQQETAATASRLRAIFDNALYAILTVCENGRIETANPALQRMLGYSPEEMLGQPVSRLLAKPLETKDGDITQHESVTIEVEGLRRDGSKIAVEVARSEFMLEDRRLAVLVLCDISERKRIDRLKDEFVSTVSHELRTPLTSIRGGLGLLDSGRLGELPESAKRLVAIALNNSERLVLLVNDILDLQKIESGSMDFTFCNVDIVALAHQALEANDAYGRHLGVNFVLNASVDLALVRADAARIMQVLSNLLSNAAKFSPRGETVELVVERHGDTLRISVMDRGPGVPAEFRPKLFSRFAQADGSDRRLKGGTGLGLAIAQVMVARHGGTIGHTDRPGGGSIFYFALPELVSATDMAL